MYDKMIYGVEFYRHPGPELNELAKDMKLLKEKGFDLIRVQEMWNYEEPEQGRYDLEKIRGIVRCAEEIGLKVVITFTLENAPPWLYRNHEAWHVNCAGEVLIEPDPYPLPFDGKPGPCWDNPAVKAAAEEFVKVFIEELGGNEAITGWAVWQEAEDSRGAEDKPFCYCRYTIEKFQLWLEKKYKTLENFNRQLMTNFSRWSYIRPPGGFTLNFGKGTFMTPLGAEFFNFMRERTGDIAAWKKDIVRKYDRRRLPIMCHSAGSILENYFGGKWDDDYILARDMDVYGKSIYPSFTKDSECQLKFIGLSMDAGRCAAPGKQYWAAELQGGRGCGSAFYKTWTPEIREFENWTLMCLAREAKGIIYWQYREEIILAEAYGHGMLNRRGEPMPWMEALSKCVSVYLKTKSTPGGIRRAYTYGVMWHTATGCFLTRRHGERHTGKKRKYNERKIWERYNHHG